MTVLEMRRAELGLTQQELAERAGVHRQTVSAYELRQHRRRPRAAVLGRIAAVLGVPASDLLREVG